MAHDLAVTPRRKLNLRKIDPASTAGVPERDKADAQALKWARKIGELQDVLYASGTRSLLVILQGMDAAGKDGTVRHVFDDVNPTGVRVTSFKSPTPLEQRHDFLWRVHEMVPPRGEIGVFNRSHYEEVLIVRVHADRFLPPELRGDRKLWEIRYSLINDFESVLDQNGTHVLKFFLHISKAEQKRRFESRQQDQTKHWKLSASDFAERQYWNDYQHAYEQMLAATSTKTAPWYIIPADRKWVRNYHITRIVCATLEKMKLKFPPTPDPRLVRMKIK